MTFGSHLGQGSRAEVKNLRKGQLCEILGLRGQTEQDSEEGRCPRNQEKAGVPLVISRAQSLWHWNTGVSGWNMPPTVGSGPSGVAARRGHGKSRAEGDHVPLLPILAIVTERLIILTPYSGMRGYGRGVDSGHLCLHSGSVYLTLIQTSTSLCQAGSSLQHACPCELSQLSLRVRHKESLS